MIRFSSIIEKFGKKGEKTGWTYIEISAAQAKKLKPGVKKSFYIKGKLDAYAIKRVALIPMGAGVFILPLNAEIRKKIGKKQGASLLVQIEEDKSEFKMNGSFIECLQDDSDAHQHFKSLTGSHQRYFSKWIDSAKTDHTKAKRIAMALSALAKGWGYPEMLRNSRPREN